MMLVLPQAAHRAAFVLSAEKKSGYVHKEQQPHKTLLYLFLSDCGFWFRRVCVFKIVKSHMGYSNAF